MHLCALLFTSFVTPDQSTSIQDYFPGTIQDTLQRYLLQKGLSHQPKNFHTEFDFPGRPNRSDFPLLSVLGSFSYLVSGFNIPNRYPEGLVCIPTAISFGGLVFFLDHFVSVDFWVGATVRIVSYWWFRVGFQIQVSGFLFLSLLRAHSFFLLFYFSLPLQEVFWVYFFLSVLLLLLFGRGPSFPLGPLGMYPSGKAPFGQFLGRFPIRTCLRRFISVGTGIKR